VTNAGSGGSCYSNPALDSLVKSANTKSLSDGWRVQAGNKILVDQSIPGPLVYYIHANVVHRGSKALTATLSTTSTGATLEFCSTANKQPITRKIGGARRRGGPSRQIEMS